MRGKNPMERGVRRSVFPIPDSTMSNTNTMDVGQAIVWKKSRPGDDVSSLKDREDDIVRDCLWRSGDCVR